MLTVWGERFLFILDSLFLLALVDFLAVLMLEGDLGGSPIVAFYPRWSLIVIPLLY